MNSHDGEPRSLERLFVAARDGDARAREAFAEFYVPHLSQRLRARYPQDDPDFGDSAAADAVMQVLDGPARFDPALGSIDAFLWGVAQMKRIKLLSRMRRSNHADDPSHAIKAFAELNGREMDSLWSENDNPAIELEQIESCELVLAKIDSIRRTLSIEHNQVLDLILRRERSYSAYEAIFRNGTSDPKELRRLVKRAKDCVWYHLNSIGVMRKSRSS